MEIRVIGSSSAGNAYVLRNASESLLIECGLSWSAIQTALDYQIGNCSGCIVSHEHGDHAKSVRQVMRHMIPVYASAGTLDALNVGNEQMARPLHEFTMVRIGSFDVMPFGVQHDAAEPFGYLIRHPECGTILFATDTYYLKYTFPGINHMMIECNYKQDIIDRNVETGLVSDVRRNRTIQSHLSIETLLEIIRANDMANVRNILLIHLSPDNSDAEEFERIVREETGTNVIAARPGITININKQPF